MNSEFIEISIVSTAYPLVENIHIDFVLVSIYSPLALVRIAYPSQSVSEYNVAGAVEIGANVVR